MANERYDNAETAGRQYWDQRRVTHATLHVECVAPGDSSTWLQLIKNNLHQIDESEWASHLQGH